MWLFSTNSHCVGSLEHSRTDMQQITEEISCNSPRAVASRPAASVSPSGLKDFGGIGKSKTSEFPISDFECQKTKYSFTYFCCTHSFVSCCFVGPGGRSIYTQAAPSLAPSADGGENGGINPDHDGNFPNFTKFSPTTLELDCPSIPPSCQWPRRSLSRIECVG
ncbi:hypothetical protein LZ31DRAFT_103531 [Colletotrichum somersetense]|nr:hypothetical protein LZ31DRAFT_103531 [Colletotrichum somersetense]